MSLADEATPPPTTRRAAAPMGLPEIQIAAPAPAMPQRLASLDIFRGIAIASMLLVNNPGSWRHMYAPLKHADWHGWTPTDLIFPFFLFIVGVAIPFSLAKRSSDKDASRPALLAGIWSRALALVMLGLLLAGFPSGSSDPLGEGYKWLGFLRVATYWIIGVSFVLLLFPWRSRKLALIFPVLVAGLFAVLYFSIYFANKHALENGIGSNFNFGAGVLTPWKMRFPGVLQRIGICYGVGASIALFLGWRGVLAAAVILMAVYAALMLAMPYDNHVTGSLSKEDNLARRIDEDVFGEHNYRAYPDPEGLLSTLPAIGTVLLGVLVGLGLIDRGASPSEKAARLLAGGVFASILGVLLGWWLMPINKQIWTPSFTVFTAGMAMLGLGAIYYVADVRGRRAWALPLTIYGMNAIAAFVFSGILVRLGQIIKVTEPGTENRISLIGLLQMQLTQGIEWLSDGMQQLSPHMPVLATPNNLSLAYALAFVLVMLMLMSVMYVLRVFLKV